MNTQETTQESSPATAQSTQANAQATALSTQTNLQAATQTNTSTLYLNRIRLYAAFLVVVIHVSTLVFYATPIYSKVWKISAFYDGLARIAVPLFIFLSVAPSI